MQTPVLSSNTGDRHPAADLDLLIDFPYRPRLIEALGYHSSTENLNFTGLRGTADGGGIWADQRLAGIIRSGLARLV